MRHGDVEGRHAAIVVILPSFRVSATSHNLYPSQIRGRGPKQLVPQRGTTADGPFGTVCVDLPAYQNFLTSGLHGRRAVTEQCFRSAGRLCGAASFADVSRQNSRLRAKYMRTLFAVCSTRWSSGGFACATIRKRRITREARHFTRASKCPMPRICSLC